MNKVQKQVECIDCRRRYKGVGFIKSRKSESKLMDMAEDMLDIAIKKGIILEELIVDDGSGRDIDREAIDQVVEWMEKDSINVVIVHSIYDITRDETELKRFLLRAGELGVSIYSMEAGTSMGICIDEGC